MDPMGFCYPQKQWGLSRRLAAGDLEVVLGLASLAGLTEGNDGHG